MANRYWIGGSGNSNDEAHWSLSSGGAPITPLVIDQYPTSNYDGQDFLSVYPAYGQSFTGNGQTLGKAAVHIAKSGTPTGTMVLKIYAHTGTYGSGGLPTGSALATSETKDVSTLTGSFAMVEFAFSGVNQITLTNGTHYVLVLEYSGGQWLMWAKDGSSPTHGGNSCYNNGSSWNAGTNDMIFAVYRTGTSDMPTITEDVIIDDNSGFGSGGSITLKHSLYCKTLTFNTTHTLTVEDTYGYYPHVAGDLTLASGVTLNGYTEWELYPPVSTETHLHFNGGTINCSVAANGPGTVKFTENVTVGTDFSCYGGTLDTDGYNLTTGDDQWNEAYSGTIYLYYRNSTIVCNGEFEFYESGGTISADCGTSTIKCQGPYAYFAGKTLNRLELLDTGHFIGVYDNATIDDLYIIPGKEVWFGKNVIWDVNKVDMKGTDGNLIRLYGDYYTLTSYYEASTNYTYLYNGSNTAIGQSFTGNGFNLSHINVGMRKVGAPTGSAYLKIYAHTGTYGVDGLPTGAPLATSAAFDVSTITGTGDYSSYIFTFADADKIMLENGVRYFFVVEYAGGDASNNVGFRYDNTSPTATGNYAIYNGSWTADATKDIAHFYVYYRTFGTLRKNHGFVNADYLNINFCKVTGNDPSVKFFAGNHSTNGVVDDGWIYHNPHMPLIGGGGAIPTVY